MIKFNYFVLIFAFLFANPITAQNFDISKTDITFNSGRYTLHGQLITPNNAKRNPVLIFLVKAGEEASYKTDYKDFLFEYLENVFLNEGIALLFFEKRGIGNSEGKWQRTNLYERAVDTKAAIDFLKTHPKIDSTKIGVIGHREGGWVAQIVGDYYSDDVKLVASIGTSTYDINLTLTNKYYSTNLCQYMSDKIAFDRATKKAVSDINWVSWFPLKKQWRELREMRNFNPIPHILNLEVPSLFIFGQNDALVYPEWALGVMSETFNNDLPSYFKFSTLPGVNQDLKQVEMCATDEEINNASYSQELKPILKTWILDNI